MDEFLAKEREILGDDADLFNSDSGAGPTVIDGGIGGDLGDFASFEYALPALSVSSDPVGIDFDAPAVHQVTTASFAVPSDPVFSEEETPAVKQWKAKFAATIADRDSRSSRKHEETLATAKASLERFYAEYNDKKAKIIAKNKENELALQARDDINPSGNVWEKVVKQIDLSSLSAASAKKPTKPSEMSKDDKAKKALTKTKDTSRMKSLLLSLKQDKNAPGLTEQQ